MTTHRVVSFVLLLTQLTLSACAPLHHTAAADPASPDSVASMLRASDLEGAPYPSLYEAIQALRGGWLVKRGLVSINAERPIAVYLDGNLLGGPESLQSIATFTVASARRLTPPEAQAIYGLNHVQGAIVVETKKPD